MLHSPWYLLMLVFVPLAGWCLFAGRRRGGVTFSSIQLLQQLPPTWRQRLAWLPRGLTLLAVTLLIVGLARPRAGREQTIVESEGIAIELVVDRSGSMRAMDFQIDGQPVDRLTAIKSVAGKFVSGGDGLEGRPSDMVGLVTFAGFADAVTPPTLDHAFLIANLNATPMAASRREDGTAIGDAVALAIEKLNALDDQQAKKIDSKIVILLTDGENTAGELEPMQAAELAESLGIKVYTIGVGTQGQAPVPVRDAFTGRQVIQWMNVNIDEDALQRLAETTGGRYFRATDTDSLKDIYLEIDQLEKSELESQQFVNYRELAVQPMELGSWRVPPLLLLACWCLLGRWWLEQTWFRELT